MNKTAILHPQILQALARAGHSSKVLIADGNFPFHTRRGPNADLVFLNFAPGQMSVTDILTGILKTVPVELAQVMKPARTGPYGMKSDPPAFAEFAKILQTHHTGLRLKKLDRFAFYEAACSPDVTLTIASGDQRWYANILLTIGAVPA